MGNDVEVGVRGDDDVACANLINIASDEDLEKILAALEEEALIDRAEIKNREQLIKKLPGLSVNDKKGILARVEAGEFK
jgi:hypothetical protein